jgi:hypothetical protein
MSQGACGTQFAHYVWVRPQKPTVVKIGDDFLGIMMPVKPDVEPVPWKPPDGSC